MRDILRVARWMRWVGTVAVACDFRLRFLVGDSAMQWGRKKKPRREQSAPPAGQRLSDQQDWVDGSSVVIPAITLPSMPSIRTIDPDDPGETPTSLSQFTPRQRTTARPLSTLGPQSGLPPLDEQTMLPVPPPSPPAQRLLDKQQATGAALRAASGPMGARVVVIGKDAPKPVTTPGIWAVIGQKRAMTLLAGLTVILLFSIVAGVIGGVRSPAQLSQAAWKAFADLVPYSGPVAAAAAPESLDAKHYINKYGFDQPNAPTTIGSDERARLAVMLPAAIKAASAYDARYKKSIEPQLVVFWTHAEGIRGRINYSNCANQNPDGGYFKVIQNCNQANFWQLGYGNQFSEIYVLKNAFTDLYGDPNDKQTIARVGQAVLDFDRNAGTTPQCGGYSCTFPAKTIDELMEGIDMRTGVVAEGNWWAAVLSRDPLINCYMIAHALTFFTHNATKNWRGCYYQEPCWQRISDRLGDIIAAWPDLYAAAGLKK